MALRNQPYLPLYVQDFLTDEKLIECSAETTGVYIRLMCIMHKSETYGVILLKQKDKQTDKQILNFAYKLAKQMPYDVEVIERSLNELLNEKVLILEGDQLLQKRMVKDNDISEKRAKAGSKGGTFAQANIKANTKANTEYEYENENENEEIKKGEIPEIPLNPEKEKLIKDIAEFWQLNEIANMGALRQISAVVTVGEKNKTLPYMIKNFTNYKKYITKVGNQFKCNIKKFIGDPGSENGELHFVNFSDRMKETNGAGFDLEAQREKCRRDEERLKKQSVIE